VLKKVVIGGLILVVLVLTGGVFWVRSVLAGDGVRTAIAGQISKAIGQPVSIGRINASAYPRVTVNLGDVRIGESGSVHLGDLQIGTAFRALLSRRIEHATLRLTGAKIQLPLPPLADLTGGSSQEGQASGASPVELVSIDEIVLSGVEIVSGGRTLRGDIEVVPQGKGVLIKKVSLTADAATITATGQITDMAGPVGEINLKASTLNVDQLMAFADDFSKGSGLATAPDLKVGPTSSTAAPDAKTPERKPASASSVAPTASGRAGPTGMNVAVTIDADRATMGQLVLQKLSGRARITSQEVILDPASFGIFDGKYEGSLTLTLGDVPNVKAHARLTGVDVAAATAFAGSPNTITGRLSGQLDFAGRGPNAAALTNSAKGKVRVDVADGVVKNLGLVRAAVAATSMRSGSAQNAGNSTDEPFSKLGATLTIANGAVSTSDLLFVSRDLNLSAQGVVQLNDAIVDLKGKLQLSDELSKQAGQDTLRYTQDQGRLTLPVTITGPSSAPSVRIDVSDMAKRAAKNAATDEAQKRLKGGLAGLLKH
jgi:uncharacterized protein involved in outer membrane biogenesis